jgi:hypothetical protein
VKRIDEVHKKALEYMQARKELRLGQSYYLALYDVDRAIALDYISGKSCDPFYADDRLQQFFLRLDSLD